MRKNNPLVSIIVPVYNEEKYLESCLKSLLSQSYNLTELILVDDGSTDEGLLIAKKYPIRVISQTHKGPGAARNKGVGISRGEIIVLADADMRYDNRYIEFLIKPILLGGVPGTFVKEEYVANKDNLWSQCWSVNSGLPYSRRISKDHKNTENAFRAIRKDIFVKGKGYEINEGYTDDSSLSKKINILAVNAPGAKSYHYNPSNIVEVYFSARWIGRSMLFKKNIVNALRFSPLNSIRIAFRYILKRNAPSRIIVFKIIYDLGMLSGIFFGGGKTYK